MPRYTDAAQLHYNPESDRLYWGDNVNDRLSCGWPLQVLMPGADEYDPPKWVDTRLEYSHDRGGWYLIDLPGVQPSGLWARGWH